MQIVGYDTGAESGEPALILGEGGDLLREALSAGRDLGYTLGERRCAGTIAEGTHRACDSSDVPYCEAHSKTWICARCTGTCLKDEMDCFEEHAVYLAAFAPAKFKVGVTRAPRLGTRLREQGADRGAHVHTVENGRIAREIESEIARGIPDRVRVPAKVRGLRRSVDGEAWMDLLAEFNVIDRATLEYGLDLDDQPVAETIAGGTVVGTKGRVLVLECNGTIYAVDMRDLVGYEVNEGSVERALQSSLGAFG